MRSKYHPFSAGTRPDRDCPRPCHECGEYIRFRNLGKGRWQPISVASSQPHRCGTQPLRTRIASPEELERIRRGLPPKATKEDPA